MTFVDIGAPFRTKPVELPPDPVEAFEDRVAAAVAAAVAGVLQQMSPPQVYVDPPDLTEIVEAVVGLQGGPNITAEDIADAIAERLRIPEPPDPTGVMAEVADVLGKLEFRLRAIQGAGGGGPSTVSLTADTIQQIRPTPSTAGDASAANQTTEIGLLRDVKRAVTDYETRLDYDTRTDGNPVYVGKNTQGTATATATWTIQKFAYDASSRPTRVEVLTGSWDNRASLSW